MFTISTLLCLQVVSCLLFLYLGFADDVPAASVPDQNLKACNCTQDSTSHLELDDETRGLIEVHKVLNNHTLYNKISRPYDRNVTKRRNSATVIYPKIDVLRLGDVSLQNLFSIDLYFTQRWNEPRLNSILPVNLSKIKIRGELIDHLWLPDTIIRNSEESKHPDAYQRDGDDVLVLHKNGDIHYTSRLSAICFCHLDLSYFPFDDQVCRVEFESLNYEANELVYNISGDGDPVFASLAPNATLPIQFMLKNEELMSQCEPTILEYHGGERYSTFCIRLHFVRNPWPIILRSHCPAIFIVLGSFLGFLIHYRRAPARVALAVTSFLSIVALGLIKGPSSDSDFVTAVDIYQIGCSAIVFLTLCELAIVHYHEDRKAKKRDGTLHIWVSALPCALFALFRSLYRYICIRCTCKLRNETSGLFKFPSKFGVVIKNPMFDDQAVPAVTEAYPMVEDDDDQHRDCYNDNQGRDSGDQRTQDIRPEPCRKAEDQSMASHPCTKVQDNDHHGGDSSTQRQDEDNQGIDDRDQRTQDIRAEPCRKAEDQSMASHPCIMVRDNDHHDGDSSTQGQDKDKQGKMGQNSSSKDKDKHHSKIDEVIAPLVFLTGFILFNFVYWTIWIGKSVTL
jgi:hypothetical protein